MSQAFCSSSGPAIGLAYAGYVPSLVEEHPQSVDHGEIPFELLQHDPGVLAIGERKPIVLHCASLSLAGTVPCSEAVVEQIAGAIERTATPWLGEHLAYVTAQAAPSTPAGGIPVHEVGYTVAPPMNERTLERTALAAERYQNRLGVPLLVENSPLYYHSPSSTLSQVEFMARLCDLAPVGP
ncbi:MAG: DUF692 family protein [Myxococcales bacterium]|nr:DUF692 family protein [Myxococcales bacterium]